MLWNDMLWNEEDSFKLRTLFINTEHIYIHALWDPDDMCYEKWETNIYVLQNS